MFTILSNWLFFLILQSSLVNSQRPFMIWRKKILMCQRQSEAQLFTSMGIQSHYRLEANAKSLSKHCVHTCYLQEHTSLQVFTRTWDIKTEDNFVKMLGPLCGRKCRGSPGSPCLLFLQLVAANWAEIKALWWINRSQSPLLPRWMKLRQRFFLTGHPTHPNSWLSMWYIHYQWWCVNKCLCSYR